MGLAPRGGFFGVDHRVLSAQNRPRFGSSRFPAGPPPHVVFRFPPNNRFKRAGVGGPKFFKQNHGVLPSSEKRVRPIVRIPRFAARFCALSFGPEQKRPRASAYSGFSPKRHLIQILQFYFLIFLAQQKYRACPRAPPRPSAMFPGFTPNTIAPSGGSRSGPNPLIVQGGRI